MAAPFSHWPMTLLGLMLCSPSPAGMPSIELPESATSYSVGEHTILNGMPMSMRGFTSRQSVDEAAAWFRRSLGTPLVENRIGETLVLGKANGDHYLTVQLRATARGTSGVAAVSDLRAAAEQRESYREQTAQWISAMPVGTRILSDMASEDRGRRSRHVVFVNDTPEQVNSDRLQRLLPARGFAFEREAIAAAGPGRDPGRTLYFKGKDMEAIATIARDARGQTVVVVNTISSLENYR